MILQIMPLTTIIAAPMPALTSLSSSTNLSPLNSSTKLDSSNNHKTIVKKKHKTRSISDILENPWENPCGGRFVEPNHNRGSISTSSRKASFKTLREVIKSIKLNLIYDEIYVDDIKEWFAHNATYKFLARVKPQSNINLARWHRHTQVYVGAISYLKKRQERVDRHYGKPRSGFAKELRQLLQTSRTMLCQIESTMNTTQLHPKIQTYSKKSMDEILTKLQTGTTATERVSEVDLKFIKVRYYEIISGMTKALNRWIRESNCINGRTNQHSKQFNYDTSVSSSNSSNGSSSKEFLDRFNSKMCQRIRERRQRRRERRKLRKNHRQNTNNFRSANT